jgi:CheY-like chemotaxis protein
MKKILIVEDNEDSLYLMKFILEQNGYETVVARRGKEGIGLAREAKPDLILMDIQLPDITGEEATRRIRRSRPLGEVPVIALTAYAMAGDRERFLSAGHNGYIKKPIEPEGLMEEIEKYL